MLTTIVLISDNGETLNVTVDNKIYYDFFLEEIPKFEETTGYDVELTLISEADKRDNASDFAEEELGEADLYLTYSYNIAYLVEKNLIQPVAYPLEDFYNASYTSIQYEGSAYMMPLAIDVPVFIYNKELMPKPPKSLIELDVNEWTCNFLNILYAEPFIRENLGYVFDIKPDEGVTIGLDNPNTIATVERIQGFYTSDVAPWSEMKDPLTADEVLINSFINGEVSSIIISSENIDEIEESNINYGVAPIPSWDGTGTNKPLVSTRGFVVSINCDNVEAANEFMYYMTTESVASDFVTLTNSASPLMYANYPANSDMSVIAEIASTALATPNSYGFQGLSTIFTASMVEIVSGSDVESVLLATEEAMNEYLDTLE